MMIKKKQAQPQNSPKKATNRMKEQVNIFWFRRDLRISDNTGLNYALEAGLPVLPLFIFDSEILDKLEEKTDPRVEFIYEQIVNLSNSLKGKNTSILIKTGKPQDVFKTLLEVYDISAVFANHDYEPYAKERDKEVKNLLAADNVKFITFKDQVIFEKQEILNDSGEPYKVFTPYKNKWIAKYKEQKAGGTINLNFSNFFQTSSFPIPTLEEIGFKRTNFPFPPNEINQDIISNYDKTRDFPSLSGTSRLGIHLRFGTLSIREITKKAAELNSTFLNELIWREFYMMVLDNFPHVVNYSFKSQYDNIRWRNNEEEFHRWCIGKTGYPIVDAGMRQMNETGYMHNRVRMITASFLSKHLLIDWRWGEAYFAKKLLDYELASNNGGWQWAAGTGTDAQPYFRVFNPTSQVAKFDKDLIYIKRWVPELNSLDYPLPMVDHKMARERAIETYKKALK
jgi:deoxyribodipyrimidine photo-lyase